MSRRTGPLSCSPGGRGAWPSSSFWAPRRHHAPPGRGRLLGGGVRALGWGEAVRWRRGERGEQPTARPASCASGGVITRAAANLVEKKSAKSKRNVSASNTARSLSTTHTCYSLKQPPSRR
eukprot:scaffold82464_cov66-Phaeocystis_antarctica.AAC.8